MAKKYFIGLDLGTSGVKGALLSLDGVVKKTVTVSFEYYTKADAKLMSAENFISSCFSAIKQLAADADGEVMAICSSGAAGSMTALNSDGEPIIPIIGWQTKIDKDDLSEFYSEEEKKELRHLIGWPIGLGFPGAYIPAIKKHRPDIFSRVKTFVMSIEYLNFTLTGRLGISHSLATPSDLCDQRAGVYNKKLLGKLSITEDMLPPLMEKCTSLGKIKPEIAKELLLPESCQVTLGSFDHPAGAVGSGVFDVGNVLLSLGTSWVTLFPIEAREHGEGKPVLIDRFLLSGAPYLVMKSIASVTDRINEARRRFFGDISFKDFDALASASSLGAGGLSLELSDSDVTLAEGKEPRHIARAIIEAAAGMLKNNLSLMREMGFCVGSITMIGGITNSAVCSKIIAETIGMQITVINGESAGAVGSAMLAAVGVGEFENEREAFLKMNFERRVYNP